MNISKNIQLDLSQVDVNVVDRKMPVMTYLMSTYNKLPFLKEVLQRLLKNISDDEELVIIDGGSTDGSFEYLTELQNAGKISLLVSEIDHGEAHGFNKGLLLSNGVLIKIISDDDAFHWDTIKKCKEYMIENSNIDVLGTNGGVLDLRQNNPYNFVSHDSDYKNHQSSKIPFAFCGLGLMIRKSSLPILGLFDTNYMRVDAEYSLRITSSKAIIGWCKSPTWVRIVNPHSNSVKQTNRGILEGEKLELIYFSKFLVHKKIIRILKDILRPIKRLFSKTQMYGTVDTNWPEVFSSSDQWLEDANKSDTRIFL